MTGRLPDPKCMFPDEDRCGTLSAYTNHKCRGDACTAANREYHTVIRPKKMANEGRTCSVPDCSEPEKVRGLCHRHYENRRMHGEIQTVKRSA